MDKNSVQVGWSNAPSAELHKHCSALSSELPGKLLYSLLPSPHPQDMWSLAIFVLLAERTAEHAKHLITKFQPCDTTQ